MEVKYEISEAKRLITNIQENCSLIGENAGKLLDLMDSSGMWDDKSFIEFKTGINQIFQNLQDNMNSELDCMEEFQRCINELRG